jgi:hypothetical protein
MLKRWAGPRKLQVEAKTPLRKMPDHAFDRVEKKMGTSNSRKLHKDQAYRTGRAVAVETIGPERQAEERR